MIYLIKEHERERYYRADLFERFEYTDAGIVGYLRTGTATFRK